MNEQTQSHSRVDLAKEQLEVALSLFLDRVSYASSITLAGAAEEVFGKALEQKGKSPILTWKLEQMSVVHKLMHGKDVDRKEFYSQENRIRNSLKHFDKSEELKLTADLENAACWMLVRACENATRLNIEIARFDEFDEWFYSNVVGI